MFFYLFCYKIAMVFLCHLRNHSAFFITRQSIINKLISNAIVFKWDNQIIRNCITKSKLIRNVMVKQFKYVLVVKTLRCCRQSEQKLRLKISNNLFIGFGCSMMAFINNNVVELTLGEQLQRIAHSNIGRKHKISIRFFTGTTIDSICHIFAEYLLKSLQGFFQNRSFMNNI